MSTVCNLTYRHGTTLLCSLYLFYPYGRAEIRHPITIKSFGENNAAFITSTVLSPYIWNFILPEKSWPTEFISQNINERAWLSVDDATAFILSNCTTILDAARVSGKLLYRGEGAGEDEKICRLVSVEGTTDLLTVGTYNSSPFAAAEFFSSVDKFLFASLTASLAQKSSLPSKFLSFRTNSAYNIAEHSIVRPKYGHLATSDVQAASQWGVPVSVWPLDSGLHFAWLKSEAAWWNPDWAGWSKDTERESTSKRKPYFWRNPELLRSFVQEEVKMDQSLETALFKGNEAIYYRILDYSHGINVSCTH